MKKEEIIKKVKFEGVELEKHVAEIPDFPEAGVSFKDITPVLQSPELFKKVNDVMEQLATCTKGVDMVVSPESRGFLFGPVLADRLKVGFVPARKPGKLPRPFIEEPFGKEYGKDMIQIHRDAIKPGQRVIIVDDVLATGGTAKAIANLIERLGGTVVGYIFFIELCYLHGAELLGADNVLSVVEYK